MVRDGNLHPSNRTAVEDRALGEKLDKGHKVVGRGFDCSLVGHAHDEIDIVWLLDEPLVDEVLHLPDHAVVVDLHLRLDALLGHLSSESLKLRTWIRPRGAGGLADGPQHGTYVQGRHLGLRVEALEPLCSKVRPGPPPVLS